MLIILIFFNTVNNATAQSEYLKEFIGALKLLDSTIITYKINFSELQNGKIEGSSITDFYGTNKTKSKIEGAINKNKKTISFFETENLSTKSNAKPNDFCYIHVNNAKIKTKGNKTIIQGTFEGKLSNASKCINGSIYLMGTDFLITDTTLLNKKINSDNINITGLLKKTEENQLKNNEVLKLNWKSNVIVLELWDAAKVDNDKITVFVNDKPFLENYSIKKEKYTVSIPFIEESCKISILALNEGETLLNTVNGLLKDGNDVNSITTSLKTGEKTTILFQKTKGN